MPWPIDDEMQAIALNYTSGTTGEPKGVIYSHRGAYLNALGWFLAWQMSMHPVYLWTLPISHLCDAPVVLGLLTDLVDDLDADGLAGLHIMTAGAAPITALIRALSDSNAVIATLATASALTAPVAITCPNAIPSGGC